MPSELEADQARAEQYLVDKDVQEVRRRARLAALAAPPENVLGLWLRTKALWGAVGRRTEGR